MSRTLVAFVCLRIDGDHYASNSVRARILLATLSTFWRGEPLEIIVCVRADEMDRIREELGSWPNISLRFLDEDAMLFGITAAPARGWFKQQILKLAAASIVDAKFYLTLDPDIVCCKPISTNTLLPGGKALTQWARKELHPAWWRESARIVGMEGHGSLLGIGVTPNLFARDIAMSLTEHIERTYGQVWWRYLLSAGGLPKISEPWCENALYFMMAERLGVTARYHWLPDEYPDRLHARANIWTDRDIDGWDPTSAFEQARSGYFIVLQSSSFVDPDLIWDRIKQHVGLSHF